ncbi:MAG: hypothetical protein WBQ68_06475 [Terriglobales bacterium]
MQSPLLSIRLVLVYLALSILALAQQIPPAPASMVDDAFIQKQFGSTCKLMPGPPQLKADLDGDGIDDLVVAGHCTNPLTDQAEDNFTVIDPYNQFYGYGDTKITTQFASEDPAVRGLVLLVIHGSGPEAWRADKPKAKFVIINLPFKQITVKKLSIKKKTVMAIYAEETGGDHMTSTIFWDGKKYRYQPIGSGMGD